MDEKLAIQKKVLLVNMESESEMIKSPRSFQADSPFKTISTNAPDEASNTSFGLIAEEVHDVLSDLVMYEADGTTPDAVDYPLLSVLLLEELKKLRARIEVLEGN